MNWGTENWPRLLCIRAPLTRFSGLIQHTKHRHTKTWPSLEEHCIFNLEDEAHPGSVEYSLADTVNLVVCALHFAVNQTDPCQPAAVRRMRPDRQRELPGSVLLAYCRLPKKKTSMCSTCFVVPSGLDSCDGHILSFLSLFSLYRIQVDGWNAALLYIQFVVKPQFNVKSVWAERLALVLYRAADETLLIGYSTLNKDVSSLISFFFYACTINLIFGPLFLQCGRFWGRFFALDVWFQRENLSFVLQLQ